MTYLKRRGIVWIASALFLFVPQVALSQDSSKKAPAPKSESAGASQTLVLQDPTKKVIAVKNPVVFIVKIPGIEKLTLSPPGLPEDSGLSFDPTTGILKGTPEKVTTYTLTFGGGDGAAKTTQVLTLVVQNPPAPNKSKGPCQVATYTLRIRTLQGTFADGLAQAINGSFDMFTAVAVPSSSDSGSDKTQASPPGGKQNSPPAGVKQAASPSGGSKQDPSNQNTSTPKQFLCIYERDADSSGNFVPIVPPKSEPPASSQLSYLLRVIQRLDRPEFANGSLDARFLVRLSTLKPLHLVSTLSSPAPGFELSEADAIENYLVIHPATSDLQLATKAPSDLAAQAGKIKHDLLALDVEAYRAGHVSDDPNLSADPITAMNDSANSDANLPAAQKALETWDALHTVQLQALNPRDVVLALARVMPTREMQLLAEQRAIRFRPVDFPNLSTLSDKQRGVLVASDVLQRETISEKIEAQKKWEKTLQNDGASNGKQSQGSSTLPPVTQTNSTTTITTPQPASGTTTKTAPSIQVQTTTSSQTTTAANQQSGSGSPNSSQSQSGNSTPTESSSAGNAGNQGAGNSAGNANTGAGSPGTAGNKPGSTASPNSPSGGQSSAAAPQLDTGTVVRLYHLRQASNIATVINALAAESGNQPFVQALEENGNDDIILILPPVAGQTDQTDSIRRTIAYLDEPRPSVSLQVWSYEISSQEERNFDDWRGRTDQASEISDAYIKFIDAVHDVDDQVQNAMAVGVATAISIAVRGDKSKVDGDKFTDNDFKTYLTSRSEQCIKSDQYCLGYENGLEFGRFDPADKDHPNNKAVISLERFVVLLAATKAEHLQTMIDETLKAMEAACASDAPCRSPQTQIDTLKEWTRACTARGQPTVEFPRLKATLTMMAQPANLSMFRAAVLNFLFYYKWSQAYPNEFDPYYLQRSAQSLDGYLNTLITALNKDLDKYIHKQLEFKAGCITKSKNQRVGLANYGEVQVSSISGDSAIISGVVNNYFDITQPAMLKDVLSGLLGGAGGSGGSGGNNQGNNPTSGGGGTAGGNSTGNSSGNTGGGSTTPSTGSTAKTAGAALASAANLLTPWQAVALNALATASAPPQLTAQVNAQTTLAITPISLDTASAAELNLSLQISNPTTTIDASKGSTSSFIRKDMANSVANFSVQTRVRVDSLKLFQVSSLSMDLSHPQSPVVIPVVGWAWEAVFGGVPGMRTLFTIPRPPATIQNRAIAVVRAVVVPTAMDLGLSMPFRDDYIEDAATRVRKSTSSLSRAGNKFEDFHMTLIHCILEGHSDCMTRTSLSKLRVPGY
jgi:hypothetical protein